MSKQPSETEVLAALAVLRAYVGSQCDHHTSEEFFDFGDWNGPVPAHRHINPDGTIGGWVANTAYVAKSAYIGPNARVFGRAHVSGNARVDENARVFGDAVVYNARVRGFARLNKCEFYNSGVYS